MRALTSLPLVLGLAALAACATIQPDSDGIARAGIGQTANINGAMVTPLAVLEDSRCPVKAQCVWAGQVRITARIDTGGGYQTRDITSNKPFPVAGGTLELVEVQPARVAGEEPIRKIDYLFGFRLTAGT